MDQYVALLRGTNVGKAKRIAMADLRGLFEGLGYTNVRTLLNSGNVVFRAAGANAATIAASVEKAISHGLGLEIPVVVLSANELHSVTACNPIPQANTAPAKFLVGFVQGAQSLDAAVELNAVSWEPEAFALGNKAAYLWCANGIRDSRIMKAFAKAAGDAATTRNWSTVLKLQAMLDER